jgi:hypothetical protein
MTETQTAAERIAAMPGYALAELASCATPDGPDSPGAQWLRSVAADTLEAWTYDPLQDPGDAAHSIADAAVPVYTYPAWRIFVDLGGWQELDNDPDGLELGSAAADALRASESYRVPMLALYGIGRRLADALWADLGAE